MSDIDPGFGVYVHWPFCDAICPYCDFNVHLNASIDEGAWRDALINELAHYGAETHGRTVTSLYFGGGTPSLMQPETIAALVDALQNHWSVSENLEITLEVNPTSGERARLRDFQHAGVNRVSVGIQSLDDNALKFLGRTHKGVDARRTLEAASSIFSRTTFDLIYALPEQSLNEWTQALLGALAFAQGHVSLYQLTIESGTPFSKQGQQPADENVAADMFEATQDILANAGWPAYEISNHAQPGDESRHNLTCWRGGDYLGIGPGAHGRLTLEGAVFGTHQIHNPKRWLEMAQTNGHGTAKRRLISSNDRARELIMMGLRLKDGVDRDRFKRVSAQELETVLDAKALKQLIDGGLIQSSDKALKATAEGQQRLNAVLAKLLN